MGEREPKSRSISRETSFARDTDDRNVVDGMLSYLAQRATAALRAEGLVAKSVGVRLRYSDFQTVETRQRLPQPTDRDPEILARVRALWPARWTRRVRLRLVGVVLHDLVPADDRQLLLRLAPRDADRPAAGISSSEIMSSERGECEATPRLRSSALASTDVDLAIDRIRTRHGFGAVLRGRALTLLDPRSRPRRAKAAPPQMAWSMRGLRLHTPGCSR